MTTQAAEQQACLWIHWEQGEQMRECLELKQGNVLEALRQYRLLLFSWDRKLQDLIEMIEQTGRGQELSCQADAHQIDIYGPCDLIQRLVSLGLLEPEPEWDEEANGDEDAANEEK